MSVKCRGFLAPTAREMPRWVLELYPSSQKKVSKLGEHDDPMAIDSARMLWATHALRETLRKPAEENLNQIDYSGFLMIFATVCCRFGASAKTL